MYKPSGYEQFATPLVLQVPTFTKELGVVKRTYEPANEILLFASVKTYGGTESIVNGLIQIIDTMEIVTWYNPMIDAQCRIKLDGTLWEVLGTPEDIEQRHVYCKFKVKRIGE